MTVNSCAEFAFATHFPPNSCDTVVDEIPIFRAACGGQR